MLRRSSTSASATPSQIDTCMAILDSPAIINLRDKCFPNSIPSTTPEQKELIVCAYWLALFVDHRKHIQFLQPYFTAKHKSAFTEEAIQRVMDTLEARYKASGSTLSQISFRDVREFATEINNLRDFYHKNLKTAFEVDYYFVQKYDMMSKKEYFEKQRELLADAVKDLVQVEDVQQNLAKKPKAD